MDATGIRKQLKRHFSAWRPANIVLTDPVYDDVDASDLQAELVHIPARGDCDDYARELWCYLRHLHPQWPIGICLLSKVASVKTNHAMIVCACPDGPYLVEPQVVWDIGLSGMTKMWKAQPSMDRFYFVYI